MGDRVWAQIQLSGRLNSEHVEELVGLLRDQGCQAQEGPEGPLTAEHLVYALYDNECNYGNMDEVEAFCRSHGISYFKEYGSGGGFSAGYLLYNAVVDQDFEATGEDEPALGVSELAAYAKQGKTLQDIVDYLRAMKDFSKHYPPLEIAA